MLDVLKVFAMIILFLISLFSLSIGIGGCVSLFLSGWKIGRNLFK
jgi:hypothetical protein